ncbi:MAG: hypothetical protein KJ072_05990 [Verrucomicrobia bacterium]|nr:hypothetical protein [Verrucomicrobiota bacterium]
MNGPWKGGRRVIGLGAMLVLVVLWTGCVSTKIDWNSRLGIYTYDQAVVELGPPDKSATLSDGTRVAEWLTRSGSAGGYSDMYYYGGPRPYPYWRGHYYPPVYHYDPPTPAYFIRLIFGADGRLTDWRRVAR